MSKGDKPRPIEVDKETFNSNWESIFNKPKKDKKKKDKESK